MGVVLYHPYQQAAVEVSSLAAAKPLPSNQTEYPSNHLARPIFVHQNIVEIWELFFLLMLSNWTHKMLHMLAAIATC